MGGSNGEFLVRGRGRLCTDPAMRAAAVAAGYRPRDEYVLFELDVEEVLATEYDDGRPHYRRWTATAA